MQIQTDIGVLKRRDEASEKWDLLNIEKKCNLLILGYTLANKMWLVIDNDFFNELIK